VKHKTKTPVITTFFIIILLASFQFAQSDGSSQNKKVPQHDAAAIVKLVTVRVLDQDGQPVTNLKKENFVLYDNGKQKTITEFELHTLSDEGIKAGPSEEAPDSSQSIEGMNRRLFMFLDIQGSDVSGIANAKKAALHFVDTQLKPDDEVGILSFSPTQGFTIQTYLTTDHKKIHKEIERIKDIEVKPSPSLLSGGELNDSVEGERGSSRRDSTAVDAMATSNRGSTVGDESTFLSANSTLAVPGSRMGHRTDFLPHMYDLTQALKYIPGNKSLIVFTSRNLGPHSTALGREFANASTPVYVVNTQNWIRVGVLSLSVKKKHIWTEHPLQDLAFASGGKYFADIEDSESISRDIQFLSGNFYVLGYYINEEWDGKYHQIKVEVNRPDLQVLSQHGYFNPKPFSELSELEKKLHLFDLLFADKHTSSHFLDIPVEPLFFTGEKDLNCFLLAQIMVNEKIGIPASQVEIFFILFDEKNEVVNEMNGEIDFAPFDDKILIPYFTSNLPPGKYECRIAARDKETGQSLAGNTTFEVPDNSRTEMVLSSPLLFAAGQESHIFIFSKKNKKKEKDQELTLGKIYRYLPKNHCLVVRDIGPETKKLLAVIPAAYTLAGPADIELLLRLIPSPFGETLELPQRIIDIHTIDKNKNIIVVEICLPDLEPGKYELEIEAVEKNRSLKSSTRRSIVIF